MQSPRQVKVWVREVQTRVTKISWNYQRDINLGSNVHATRYVKLQCKATTNRQPDNPLMSRYFETKLELSKKRHRRVVAVYPRVLDSIIPSLPSAVDPILLHTSMDGSSCKLELPASIIGIQNSSTHMIPPPDACFGRFILFSKRTYNYKRGKWVPLRRVYTFM